MNRAIRIMCCCALVIFCHAQALAQTQNPAASEAQIEVTISNEEPYWVGQQVLLAVTVMAPGYFDSSVNFHLPEPAGVLIMPPSGHPVVGNTTIDDTLYVTQLFELRAWPMSAGDQTIPAFEVSFAYKKNPLDKDTQFAAVTSQSVPLSIQSPPGTEGMGTVISARNLNVQEQWQPEPGSAPIKAGTAFKRTITFSAPDIPGMIFPPFPAGKIDGFGIYQKPQVQDSSNARGGFSGKRTDTITYVAKRPGQYIIPAAEFRWFDLDSQELKTEQFPAQTLNVIVNPDLQSVAANQPGSSDKTTATSRIGIARQYWALLLIVLLTAGFAFSARVRHKVYSLTKPFRPVHLQPLNPGSKKTR